MHGQKNDLGGELPCFYFSCDFKAIHDRHINIQNRDRRAELFDGCDSFLPVFDLRQNQIVAFFFDGFAQPFPHNGMVVGNDDCDFFAHIFKKDGFRLESLCLFQFSIPSKAQR